MLMSPEILTHSSSQSHSSLADVALQLNRKNSHIRPENSSTERTNKTVMRMQGFVEAARILGGQSLARS
jgi:hypothetical protein